MKEIIRVENLSKAYRVGHKEQSSDTLFGQIASIVKSPLRNLKNLRSLTRFNRQEDPTVYWALKDINFSVNEGEVLGIIGHNGAGKSTLLKILSRITEPSSGRITVRGRIAALLEVGTGFHPELTGRDNIYMNGTILGMTRREIDRKLDEIVDFSGVEKYIDTPVKFYSSGMKVRLGFAVAAHLEPEILIIDEVLAVGDAEFQKKCLGKMQHVSKGEGRTVLFVSHNMAAIRNLCPKCLVLENGKVIFNGEVGHAIDVYLSSGLEMALTGDIPDDYARDFGGQLVKFRSVRLYNRNGVLHQEFLYREPIRVKVEFETFDFIKDYNISIMVGTQDGMRILFSELNSDSLQNSDLEYYKELSPGKYEFEININEPLLPGSYSIYLGLSRLSGTTLDWIERVYDFHVLKAGLEKNMNYRWELSWGYVLNQSNWILKRK